MKFEGYYVHPKAVGIGYGSMPNNLFERCCKIARMNINPHETDACFLQWQVQTVCDIHNQLFTYNYN